MAPKNAEVIDNPPMGSSRESAEKNNQPVVTLPESSTVKSKLESNSEGKSDSDSDSDSKPAKKKIKRSIVTSGSAVALPESSTAKRPLELAESEANKYLKISATEHVKNPKQDAEVKNISGDEAKNMMFQRLFSEKDEIALLQSVLDFNSDPFEDIDAFCNHVKKLIDLDATKIEIVNKLPKLRKKFNSKMTKAIIQGKSEDEIVFTRDVNQKVFELSRKIWGEDGILASKWNKQTPKKKKLGGTPKEKTSLSIGKEIASFFNTENSSDRALNETTLAVVWEKVTDGAEKRELEEQWKQLKEKEAELRLQRTKLVKETAKVIFKAYES